LPRYRRSLRLRALLSRASLPLLTPSFFRGCVSARVNPGLLLRLRLPLSTTALLTARLPSDPFFRPSSAFSLSRSLRRTVSSGGYGSFEFLWLGPPRIKRNPRSLPSGSASARTR